jgi:hypothetical protein
MKRRNLLIGGSAAALTLPLVGKEKPKDVFDHRLGFEIVNRPEDPPAFDVPEELQDPHSEACQQFLDNLQIPEVLYAATLGGCVVKLYRRGPQPTQIMFSGPEFVTGGVAPQVFTRLATHGKEWFGPYWYEDVTNIMPTHKLVCIKLIADYVCNYGTQTELQTVMQLRFEVEGMDEEWILQTSPFEGAACVWDRHNSSKGPSTAKRNSEAHAIIHHGCKLTLPHLLETVQTRLESGQYPWERNVSG